MSQWQKIKLVDVSEVIGGGTPNTKNYDFCLGLIYKLRKSVRAKCHIQTFKDVTN